jgi:hypothetical protein
MQTRIFTQRPIIMLGAMLLGLTQHVARASDHLDTAAVIADPAADIGDLYAWMAPDGKRLNLVMTIVAGKFSDHVRYAFHVDSGRALGQTTSTTSIECDFNSTVAPECRLEDLDRARGDASGAAGRESEQRRFRVFAGLRDDPFFNNVRGTRAALNVAAAALKAGAPRDAAGCPHFDAATTTRILDEWRHTEGHEATNLLAGWKTAALVIAVDVDAVNRGGPLLGVWATTTVRAAPPNHPPLEAGAPVDRMGRALTGNALLGTFDTEEASDARKHQYNQAPFASWQSYAPDLAATLAVYDGFDGLCGNQWLAGHEVSAERYKKLAHMLADDRLWISSKTRHCGTYLARELSRGAGGAPECGGRTPNDDAVDVFRSLLVGGHVTGVSDGVPQDDRQHSVAAFPFLAPP